MTTRLTVSSLATPQKVSVNTTFSKPLDSAGPFYVQPGLTTKGALATVNLKSIGDAAAANTTLILPGASTDYTFKTASGAVTISNSVTNPTTHKVTTTVIASLDLTKVALDTPSVKFSDVTAKFHYIAATKATTTAPAIPAHIELTSLALAHDTGASATDGITSDGTINLATHTGSTLSYSVNGGGVYTALTGTSLVLAEGNYAAGSIKVIERSAAGAILNATTNANAIVVDKTVAAPTIALASDTGTSATDGITNVKTVNVTGLETGATWQYSINGKDFVNGTGTSFTLPSEDLTYDKGDIQVRQFDKAGNESDVGTNAIVWTIDTVANAPVDINFNDTGTVDGDNITKDGKITVADLETDAKLSYSIDNGKTFTVSTDNTFTVLQGIYAKGQIQIKQIDAAGNTSSVTSSSVALTVDTTAPVAPTIAFDTDTGTAGDNITASNVIKVTGLESTAGTTWEYSVDAGKTYTAGTGSTFTVDTGKTYAKGAVLVRETDLAGNVSVAATNTADWTILPSNVDINAANTTPYDASVADIKFFVAAGNYTYNIANFNTGDKIDFPAGNTPTVINSSNTDNTVDLQYASDGKITVLHLTGLTTTQDSAIYSVNSFNNTFGANSLSSTGSSSAPAPVVTHQAVSAAGTANASTGNIVFDFAAGTYAYSVSGFATGDTLNFPVDVTPTVINTDASDKKVDVQWASSGKVVTVSLTGLTDAQDSALYSATSFKALFGANSLTNTGEPPVTPTGNSLAVSAAGSADASKGNVKFDFAAGNYDYTISGYSNGDVLNFPDDVAATVINTSTTDNSIEVQWAANGNVVHVTLTGLASDTAYSVNSFNAVFGAGSII